MNTGIQIPSSNQFQFQETFNTFGFAFNQNTYFQIIDSTAAETITFGTLMAILTSNGELIDYQSASTTPGQNVCKGILLNVTTDSDGNNWGVITDIGTLAGGGSTRVPQSACNTTDSGDVPTGLADIAILSADGSTWVLK